MLIKHNMMELQCMYTCVYIYTPGFELQFHRSKWRPRKLDPRHADGCAQQRGCRGAKLAFTAHAQNISIQTGGNLLNFLLHMLLSVSPSLGSTFFVSRHRNKEAAQEAAWKLSLVAQHVALYEENAEEVRNSDNTDS